jgi:hypothetical protein
LITCETLCHWNEPGLYLDCEWRPKSGDNGW